MLELVCGDPSVKPATFSRFVLPFAYRLEEWGESTPKIYFKPEDKTIDEEDDLIWRRRYLTEETEEVLFGRASWFELSTVEIKTEMTVRLDPLRKVTVHIKPPRIVLFEYNNGKTSDEETNLLQTGFLIVELCFPKDGNVTIDDLLKINELFRYWQKPFQGHEKKGEPFIDKNGKKHDGQGGYETLLHDVPLDLVAQAVSIGAAKGADIYFDRWATLLKRPVCLADKTFLKLMPDNMPDDWHKNARVKVSGVESKNKESWLVYADNRTFVWTCALFVGGRNEVERKKELYGAEVLRNRFYTATRPLRASDYGYWVKLLNIDQWAGNSCTEFEKTWADERTYKRWEEYGTFYGFCYHGGAMIGPPLSEEEEPIGSPLWKHFGGVYFDQTLLLLYLRTTLFRFSVRLNQITAAAMNTNNGDDDHKWQKEFQGLRREFTQFANLYQYPLLSNQQQGLEMYSLARSQMDVDLLFKEIKDEIHGSHDYFTIKQTHEQTTTTTSLTVVATIGLVFALFNGFLAIPFHNLIPPSFDWINMKFPVVTLLVFFGLIFGVVLISQPLVRNLQKIIKNFRKKWSQLDRQIKWED